MENSDLANGGYFGGDTSPPSTSVPKDALSSRQHQMFLNASQRNCCKLDGWKEEEEEKVFYSNCCTNQEKPPWSSRDWPLALLWKMVSPRKKMSHQQERVTEEKMKFAELLLSAVESQDGGTSAGQRTANYHRQPMTHQTGSVGAAPGLQPAVIAAQDARLLLTENIQIKHQQGLEAARRYPPSQLFIR